MNLGSNRNTHDFMNPRVSLPTSTFNRPSQLKTAFDAGKLIPIFTEEVLPGDTHALKTASFGRFATLIRPILDNVYLDIHYFFVPNRIMWDQWEKFQAGAPNLPVNPGQRIPFHQPFPKPTIVPKVSDPDPYAFERVPTIKPTTKVSSRGFIEDTLADYFGMPTKTGSSDIEVNCFYHRAYNKIYFDWYMDENLIDPPEIRTDSIDVDDDKYRLKTRCKRRDYFTSCLPFAQRGSPVSINLGGHLPVRGLYTGIGDKVPLFGSPSEDQYDIGIYGKKGTTKFPDNSKLNAPISSTHTFTKGGVVHTDTTPFSLQYDEVGPDQDKYKLPRAPYVDLGSSTSVTINQLREAVAIQRLLEKDARGGVRYVEIIKNHFGVTSPDYRLQRSEFLGSSSQLLNTTAVPQTSATDDKISPQAHLASYGITSSSNNVFKKTFTEHGVILGIASARVDQTYQQGLERRFTRSDRYDYYMPSLAHLGEQAVLNKEIYYSNSDASEKEKLDGIFGYIPRWDEYRFKQSYVTGAMRSNYPRGSLDTWHLATNFTQTPFLNKQFIWENPPIARVVATPSEKHFVFDFYFDLVSTRVMPITSIPSLVQKL